MSPGVPFQIEGVIEALAAEGAQVALRVTVALHVPIQQPLEAENLRAHPALEFAGVALRPCWWQLGSSRLLRRVN